MVEYLKIKNFKGIKELEIKDLSPVNIFLGKANTGKTSILEALSFLYETPTNRTIGYDLDFREFKKTINQVNLALGVERTYDDDAFESLFFNNNASETINIDTNIRNLKLNFIPETINTLTNMIDKPQSLRPEFDKEISENVNLIFSNRKTKLLTTIYNEIKKDNDKKRDFLNYLQKFDESYYECESDNKTLYIRIDNELLSKAINIKQMGQGFIFYATICALLARGDKTIIIDEIENGLHYKALSLVMDIIFDKAKNENIQFFISTHNLEFLSKASSKLESGKFGDDLVSVFNIFKRKNNSIDYIKYSQEEFIRQLDLDNEIRGF